MLDVGQRVRDYEIVAHLKPGGMATLFLARRVGPQGFARPVAIKVVHPHLAHDADMVRMFLDEARATACIQHPNVVHVEELGEVDGSWFLAMEYLHGDSLSALLAALERTERRLPIETAVHVAAMAAAGLHAAHEACSPDGTPLGLVHRDVSPQNLLVSIDGHVKVIDFGIAKGRTSAVHTETGALKGKLAYMSPEQVRGEPVDRRTDVFALGIVLWEMLTMRRLFSGPSEAVLLRIVGGEGITRPSETMPSVSAALDEVVLRALAPDRDVRFASAAELADALHRAVPDASSAGASLARLVKDELGERIDARRREIAGALPEPRGLEATSPARPASRTGARTDAHALAVMPFRTHGGDADLVEGLECELRDVLSRVRGLRVKSRIAARDAEDASAYGERVGVGLVITGRAHVDPARVRLALALTNVEDGFQTWSAKLEGTLADAWDGVDGAARAIAEALGDRKLRGGERAQGDPRVIELALELRRILAQPVVVDRAVLLGLHERMEAIAPRDASILASLAIALVRTTYAPSPPPRVLEIARECAERAIELAPDLPEPWIALAQIRLATADSPGTVRALRRALTNGPSFAEAHDLVARVLADADLLDEASRFADRALWLDPAVLFARREKVRIHALRAEWGAAEHELALMRQASVEHYLAMGPRVSLWAGRALGPPEELATTHVITPVVRAYARIFDARALGPEDVAVLEGRIAQAAQPRARRFWHQVKAEVYAFVGDRETAIAATIASVDAGLEDLAWLERCPLIAPLRTSPALAEPAQRVRARAAEVRRAWDAW